jgi:adenosylcobinamide-GDP ribazoletransferase
MNMLPYAGDLTASRITYSDSSLGRSGTVVVLVSTLIALVPIFDFSPSAALSGMVAAAVVTAAMIAVARRMIGGYTGDVLGAVEQIAEVGFLLAIAAVR